MKITKMFTINMCEHVYTVDGEIFMGEIHTCISWAKFSRDPIFADGCPHIIFETNINFCFRKVAHMQMTEAVTQKALCICGYHVYKDIWKVAVGETAVYVLEAGNFHDKKTPLLLRKMEESLAICHGRCHAFVLFF